MMGGMFAAPDYACQNYSKNAGSSKAGADSVSGAGMISLVCLRVGLAKNKHGLMWELSTIRLKPKCKKIREG
jgi:hypothetical protein